MVKEKQIKKENIIIDCFAGGGGASVGIEMALGRSVDIAINHDPQAILMHKTNHPNTLHLTEDIFKVDLQKYVGDRHVALMWASPDCTSHSKAKGGQPRISGLRILPWAVYKHAKRILPDVIIMENVEEIQQWGPLDQSGRPIKERCGEDYQKFIRAMKSLGYIFDSREMIAADYGAPTVRKRWYAIFRRDGKPIVWPEPTHSKDGTGGKERWVPVSDVLDFSNLGKSIFGRKKPLAEKTLNRIARGLSKFVFESDDPFIVCVNHGGDASAPADPIATPYMLRNNGMTSGKSVHEPLNTVLTGGHHAMVTPYITPIGYGERKGQKPRVNSANEPLSTIVSSCKQYLTTPYLIQYHSEKGDKDVRGQSVNNPLRTVDTSNRYAAVAMFLSKFYKTCTGQKMTEPLHTITTSTGHFGQVSVLTVPYDKLIESGVDEKTAQKCTWVSEFIIEYYGQGTGQPITEPLHTVVSRDRFALITVLGKKYCILDIFLRMLTPEELKRAQGFPGDYIIDRDYRWKKYPVCEQVKRIGNSVVPVMAEALVAANCGYMKVGERVRNLSVQEQGDGQLAFA